MKVFAFEGSARKDGDAAEKRLSVKKQHLKVMTMTMQFLKFKRGELPIVCLCILYLFNIWREVLVNLAKRNGGLHECQLWEGKSYPRPIIISA